MPVFANSLIYSNWPVSICILFAYFLFVRIFEIVINYRLNTGRVMMACINVLTDCKIKAVKANYHTAKESCRIFGETKLTLRN